MDPAVMRRILVVEARRRRRLKRGGSSLRVTLTDGLVVTAPNVDLLALDEASALTGER